MPTMLDRLGELQRFKARLTDNSAELEHLEVNRLRLESMLALAEAATGQQAVHTAAKQEASQQFLAAVLEGERLATVLRLAVKQFYGIRSEKLAEFGLQPFRGRRARTAPKPPVETTAPEPAAS